MLAEKRRNAGAPAPPGGLEVYELLSVPVLAIDTAFRIVFVNEKACETTGYGKEDARTKRLFDIAYSRELKRKLLRTFQGQAFERDITVGGSLLMKNGRIRKVEWQCRTLHQGLLRAGAVITFTDLTGTDTFAEIARVLAGATRLDDVACGSMDLLSDPLNLKLARICLQAPGGPPLLFTRAYPHGGVRKRPRQALRDSRQPSGPVETQAFPLVNEGRSIGQLELTPYAGSPLLAEDIIYVGRLCEILSGGLARLLTVASSKDSLPALLVTPPDPPETAPTEKALTPAEDPDMAKNLLGMLPYGVILCDRDGVITMANEAAAQIIGTTPRELEGQMVTLSARRLGAERLNGTAVGVKSLAICRAIRSGEPVVDEHAAIVVHGSRRAINTSAIPLRDGAGNVTGCLATIQDVTAIESIVRLGRMALGGMNVDDLTEESLDVIRHAAGLRTISLYLWDGNELNLRLMKGEAAGMPVPDCRDLPDPQNPSLQSRAFLDGRPVLIKDYRRCPSVRLFDPLARKRPIRSMAGVPLCGRDGMIGVLLAATGPDRPMDDARLAELAAMCSQLAAGLDRALKDGV